MEISYSISESKVTFYGTQNEEDVEFCLSRKGKAGRTEASFWFKGYIDLHSIHNDVLALTALTVFGPFSKRDIQFSWPVSDKFKISVEQNLKRKVKSLGECAERTIPNEGRGALAFSGGVDSVAAAMVLPKNTVSVFCNRIIPEGYRKGLYRSEAALKSCEELSHKRDVVIVDTDMEFARDPVGFSVDWTNAAGALLLSHKYNFNSISYGMILESAYFIGHPHYSDLTSRTVYSAWAPIFQSVGIPISLPTAMISEVATSKIALSRKEEVSAQSCVRGLAEKPCLNCYKCFRKKLLDAKLSRQPIAASHFDMAYTSKEVAMRLTAFPIHHENVLAYSLADLPPTEHPIDKLLRRKMQPIIEYGEELTWLESAYPKGYSLVPESMQTDLQSQISKFTKNMTARETKHIMN